MLYFAIGSAIGAAASAAYNYLFAPAPETTFDATYQSRWDWARTIGDAAASEREADLRAQLAAARLPRPPAPPALPDDAYPESYDDLNVLPDSST